MLGIEPRIQVLVDSFQLLPTLVAGTRRVAMIHELLAARLGLGPGSGIRLLDCPFDASRPGGAVVAPGARPRRGPPLAAGKWPARWAPG